MKPTLHRITVDLQLGKLGLHLSLSPDTDNFGILEFEAVTITGAVDCRLNLIQLAMAPRRQAHLI